MHGTIIGLWGMPIGEMFRLVARERTEAVLLIPEPLLRTHREAIADMALRHRLPLAIVGGARYLPANGLLSYGPTTAQYARITARYVDAILRGANPAVLPIEQPVIALIVVAHQAVIAGRLAVLA